MEAYSSDCCTYSDVGRRRPILCFGENERRWRRCDVGCVRRTVVGRWWRGYSSRNTTQPTTALLSTAT